MPPGSDINTLTQRNMKRDYRYIFGPVPSRRLGRSLGIDLVPRKTCTYNCVYCQLGTSAALPPDLTRHASPDDVIEEIRQRIEEGCHADHLTFSGSGEPTLHASLGDVISRVKQLTDIPVAVLTNGSLLWKEEVADALRRADVVVPSLDAGDEECFLRINRPHPNVSFRAMVDGLVSFRRSFSGQLWLEVFLVAGVNDSEQQLSRLADLAARIDPDRIQINTVARPPAQRTIRAPADHRLKRAVRLLGDRAEIVTASDRHHPPGAAHATAADVLQMLRPCTAEHVAQGLSIHPSLARTHLDTLLKRRAVRPERRDDQVYYVPETP